MTHLVPLVSLDECLEKLRIVQAFRACLDY